MSFKCPACGAGTWGTSMRTTDKRTWTGHCHGDGKPGCRFTWDRKTEDHLVGLEEDSDAVGRYVMGPGDVFRAERDQERARVARAVQILAAIQGFLLPAPVEHKGKTYRYVPPDAAAHLQQLSDRIRAIPDELPPIDMVLHCPQCMTQHIDAPEPNNRQDRTQIWLNPPHRSHLCAECGHIWRPADVPTNGVAAIKTRGKADS